MSMRARGHLATTSAAGAGSGGHGGARVSSCVMVLHRSVCGFLAGADNNAAPARHWLPKGPYVLRPDPRRDAFEQREVHRADDLAMALSELVEGAVAQGHAAV